MATYPPSSSDSSSDSCEEERYRLLRGPQVGAKPQKRGAILTTSSGNSGCLNGEGWDGDSMQACPICFEEYARRDMRSLLGCGRHTVCGGCMETHLATLISNVSTATRLTCPAPNCAVLAEVYELESLVDETTYQKYLQFTALESLKKEATAKWCTNPLCGQPIIWDEAVPVVSCPACRTQFCYHCLKAPHIGRQCGENPPPPASSSSSSSKSTVGENTPIVVSSDPDATYLTWKQQLGAKVKPCPSCKMDTEKNMGCQHMTCSNCGSQWCWLCSQSYHPRHFNDSESPCNGLQFTTADTLEEALQAQGKNPEAIQEIMLLAPLLEERQRLRRRRRVFWKALCYLFVYPFLLIGIILILPFIGPYYLFIK